MERGKSEAARRADQAEAPLHQARGLQGDAPETFQRVGLITDGGAYCLDNPMDCFGNVFYGPEIISHLFFFKVGKEEDLDRDIGLRDFRCFPVGETIIVTRKGDRNVVILSEEVYNNLLENAYLTKEKANYDWLMASKKEFEEGKVEKHSLIEEEGTAKK